MCLSLLSSVQVEHTCTDVFALIARYELINSEKYNSVFSSMDLAKSLFCVNPNISEATHYIVAMRVYVAVHKPMDCRKYCYEVCVDFIIGVFILFPLCMTPVIPEITDIRVPSKRPRTCRETVAACQILMHTNELQDSLNLHEEARGKTLSTFGVQSVPARSFGSAACSHFPALAACFMG